MEQALAIWTTGRDPAFVVLLDRLREAPKITGLGLGLAHPTGDTARHFAARLH